MVSAGGAMLTLVGLAPLVPPPPPRWNGANAQDLPDAGVVRVARIPGTEIAFSMAFVPGSTFWLGSPTEEEGRDDDEGPRRQVQVAPFWIGTHEVTHDEYEIFRFRGLDDHIAASTDIAFDADGVSRPTPPYEDPAHGLGKEGHPAVGMTRRAALYYARWLSNKTGRLYRLPTEAEWEYACRAGSDGPYGAGLDPGRPDAFAWSASNSQGRHHLVGDLAANAWGIADMHGNVAEWVLDSYEDDAYKELPADTPAIDPIAGAPPRGRGVVRGGGYDDPLMRCAERLPEQSIWKRRDPQIPKSPWWNTDSPHVGFRLVSPAREFTLQEINSYWEQMLGPS
jgi:formylglycine-generating enzyme required for sulfatase activity